MHTSDTTIIYLWLLKKNKKQTHTHNTSVWKGTLDFYFYLMVSRKQIGWVNKKKNYVYEKELWFFFSFLGVFEM